MLQRISFDQPSPQSVRRESLLTQLDRRIRHVVQGPDGYLYVVTETRTQGAGQPNADGTGNGAILRIEPAQ
jgi:glucose/arabinose dehydrogenase